jgi:hypothetical protein
MRTPALASAIAITLALATVPTLVLSQEQRKDGGDGTVKGQSQRPAEPKQAEPESSSHNAEKPKAKKPAAQPPASAPPKKSERN